MLRDRASGQAIVQSIEHHRIIQDLRKAEQEWNLAHGRFHDALGDDHVDYAIFCLEAAGEKIGNGVAKSKKRLESTNVDQDGGEG